MRCSTHRHASLPWSAALTFAGREVRVRHRVPPPSLAPASGSLMSRMIVVLAFGVLVGYSMGFKDARKHEMPFYERALESIGGSARGKYATDVDASAEKADR